MMMMMMVIVIMMMMIVMLFADDDDNNGDGVNVDDDDDGVSRGFLSERGDEEQDHQQVPQHREEQPRHCGQTRLPRLCR